MAIKALAVDPPAATASTLGGLTNLSDAAKAAMDGNVSGAATSGAMALGMDMPVAIANGVGSILIMEWTIISGIGSGLGSAASGAVGMLSGSKA